MEIKAKYFLITAIVLLFSVSAASGGYQEAEWDMSKDEVRAAMPDKNWKRKDNIPYIYFTEDLFSLRVKVAFFFVNNQLYRVELHPLEVVHGLLSGDNNVKPFDVFLQLRKPLRKKYGEPDTVSCTEKRLNEDKKLREEVELGESTCKEYWELEDTKITLQAKRKRNSGAWKPILIYSSFKKEVVHDVDDKI